MADYGALYKTLMEALGEYNETNAVMDLVLFEDAMKHVCRWGQGLGQGPCCCWALAGYVGCRCRPCAGGWADG